VVERVDVEEEEERECEGGRKPEKVKNPSRKLQG